MMPHKKRDLWTARAKAQADLADDLKNHAELIDDCFDLLDEALGYLHQNYSAESQIARVSLLVGIKGRNLALGSYSLILDALGQEAGALLRPLVEAIETLQYVREVPGGLEKAISGNLPSAGQRAKAIGGTFQRLRDHLNRNASHLSFGPESMGHLIRLSTGEIKIVQPHNLGVLRQNMTAKAAILIHLLIQIHQTLLSCEKEKERIPVSVEALGNRIKRLVAKAKPLLPIEPTT